MRLAQDLAPDLCGQLQSLVREVAPATFAKLAPVPPATGVLAIARRPRIDPAGVLASPQPAPIVLLENPSHPGNLGAVVRVAAAAGAAAVLTTGARDPWQRAALRGSAGLHFALPVAGADPLPSTDRPLLAMPGTLIGARLGIRTYHALNDRNFYDIVLALLFLSGLGLVWSSIAPR